MNYIQKQATLQKISSIKKAAAAMLLIKLATANAAPDDLAKAERRRLIHTQNVVNGAYYPGVYSLMGAGGGSAIGGLLAALLAKKDEDRLSRGLSGAFAGGLAGGGLGYGADFYQANKDNTAVIDHHLSQYHSS